MRHHQMASYHVFTIGDSLRDEAWVWHPGQRTVWYRRTPDAAHEAAFELPEGTDTPAMVGSFLSIELR